MTLEEKYRNAFGYIPKKYLDEAVKIANEHAQLHLEAMTDEIKEVVNKMPRCTMDLDETCCPYKNAEYNIIAEPILIVESSIEQASKDYITKNLK